MLALFLDRFISILHDLLLGNPRLGVVHPPFPAHPVRKMHYNSVPLPLQLTVWFSISISDGGNKDPRHRGTVGKAFLEGTFGF